MAPLYKRGRLGPGGGQTEALRHVTHAHTYVGTGEKPAACVLLTAEDTSDGTTAPRGSPSTSSPSRSRAWGSPLV